MARVLVVDDRAANREVVAFLLRHFGHDVVTATDGADGVRAANADPPDLVIMDIAMPGLDGYSAARAMRSKRALQAVPMVAVSATGAATLAAALDAGFDAFYPLPIDPYAFVAQLEPYLTDRGGSG